MGYSVTMPSLKVPLLCGVASGTSHSSLLDTAAMNTFLLATLCLLGAWAALAEGVTVQVSPVPTLVQLCLPPGAQRPCPDTGPSLWGWSWGVCLRRGSSSEIPSQTCLMDLPLRTWRGKNIRQGEEKEPFGKAGDQPIY